MKSKHGKTLYSLREIYRILYHGMRALPYLRQTVKDGTLSPELKERLMLAVTEVNGCALCAYGHTRMALESGMKMEEIEAMLGGELADVPKEELSAVLFARHYAEARGLPSKESWKQIEHLYGKREARAILSAVRVIMAGNAYGIPMGSFAARFVPGKREKVDKRSNIAYEICVIATALPFSAAAFLQAVTAFNLDLPYVNI